MAHPNEAQLREAYTAFSKGDLETAMAAFADNIRWHVQGTSPLSGVYVGREEVLAFFMALAQRSGGTFSVEVHDVLANDEHAVVLVRERAEREGRSLAVTEAHVWHLTDGTVTEFWGLPTDLAAVDEFWS